MKEGEEMTIKEHRLNETFFSKIVALISMSGVLVLSASVVYDYGYFFAFDVGIAEMPTTLSDHLRSSLNWIPGALGLIFGLLAHEIVTCRKKKREKAIKEISQLLNNFSPRNRIGFLVLSFIAPLVLSVPILYLLHGIDLFMVGLQFLSMVLWGLLFTFFYLMMMRGSPQYVYTIGVVVPPILIFVLIQGYAAADEIEKGRGNSYVFLTEKGITTSVLARTFDKHYMLWDEDKGKIRLLNMDTVIEYYPEASKKEPSKKTKPEQKSDKTQSAQESKKTKPIQKSDKTNQTVQ